jgi:hypothetical protein
MLYTRYVDEPTTGLDSVMAASVVQQLKVHHIGEGRRGLKLSPWKFVDSVQPFSRALCIAARICPIAALAPFLKF